MQGTAFNDRLDWLVGGYYANEKLTLTDNSKFGSQYGRFAACRLITGTALAGIYSPTSASCILPTVGPAAINGTFGTTIGAAVLNSLTALDSINQMGADNDVYRQKSSNWALFTHNIVHVTDTIDLTLGLRWTNEKKKFSATFNNNNTACPTIISNMNTYLNIAATRALAAGLIGLGCQGNSTSELNGQTITDTKKEDQLTGTAILSWKANDDMLFYASYAKGYKAGGFNLDRSALKGPVQLVGSSLTATFAAAGGAQALVGNLQFAPETVDAFEIGAKFSFRKFTLNIAAFRQDFKNFQLNTFNGSNFIVQNINGCSSLVGSDTDQSKFTGASNYSATASATGTCASGDVTPGVRAQGVEVEARLTPSPFFNVSAGFTYADTKYRNSLVGNDSGTLPLDQALRMLPGNNLSNAPKMVVTSAVTWTPPVGSSGMSALFYVDSRMTSDYNTGSDLFPQKAQDSFFLFNTRVGLRGAEDRWAVEFWGQNIFNQNYAQVAFNSPFQEGATSTTTAFADPGFPGGRQVFSQYLAEPRTYGITLRGKF